MGWLQDLSPGELRISPEDMWVLGGDKWSPEGLNITPQDGLDQLGNWWGDIKEGWSDLVDGAGINPPGSAGGAGGGGDVAGQTAAALFATQKPYLENIYGEGRRLYESDAGKIPSWISDQWRGIAGDQNPFAKTASGAYLTNNPYLDATYNRAAEAVTGQYKNTTIPGVRSSFGLAGGYNRGAEGEAISRANSELGRQLTGLATDVYGRNYEVERANQENAIRNQFGATGTALGESANFANNDFNRLGQYAGVVGSPFGGGAGGSQQQRANPWASAAGGALSGYGSTGSPWGALAGGLLGYYSAQQQNKG